MAGLSFTYYTDKADGVVTTSYGFNEGDSNRILTSLRSLYSDRFKPYPKDHNGDDILPADKVIIEELFAVLMRYTLTACRDEEVRAQFEQFKVTVPEIEPRSVS